MRINNIKVENFQSYFQQSTFEFTDGVNLILGENGGGKSSLFNAFYWVLFDKVYQTDIGWGDIDVRFFNARTQQLLKNNEIGKLSVSLTIDAPEYPRNNDSSTVLYTFYRELSFKKTNNNVQLLKTEDLSISFKNEFGETIRISDLEIDKCIEFLLPDAIRRYIWFQGETISDLIDFNNSKTLNNAIDKISYFPHYKSISNVIGYVISMSEDEISKHIRNSSSKSKKLDKTIYDIKQNQKKIADEIVKLEAYKEKKETLLQSLSDVKLEMRGISDHQALSDKMKGLIVEDNSLSQALNDKEQEQRESIINKWMLKGIEPFIELSNTKIKEFITEIRNKSDNDNPIPIDVPGSVYIQEMLDDEKCHICLRDSPVGSDSYKALANKLKSSADRKQEYDEKEKEFRNLEQNFTSLVSLPDDVINQVGQISEEIESFFISHDEKLNRRREIVEEKKEILNQAGISDASSLSSNVTLLRGKLEKQDNLNVDLGDIDSLIRQSSGRIQSCKAMNKTLVQVRDKFNTNVNSIPQQFAKPYIEILELISKKLEENAKENLISEIELKSTELLHGYLESSLAFKGSIMIDRDNFDVKVVDSDDIIVVLNKGNLTAAKMSVINSILSLSSEKLQKNYPMISDAPSSVFDFKNTKSYMNKIGVTFPQVIIMTKDIYDMSLNELKSINNVNRVYRLVNKVIDNKINKESITNYCTINGDPII